jgi:hypothetical protein
MFENRPEIVFNKRFLDDIFLIVKINQINDFDAWLSEVFRHEYLKFTHEHSRSEINFLDVKVKLNCKNDIQTSLYSKPMSKHMYLHYASNHPKHLLNSLPYCQGLRIIRICSDPIDRQDELLKLMRKFHLRMYPDSVLCNTLKRLANVDRHDLLIPRKPLLISNLRIHNSEILCRYNVNACVINEPLCSNKIYVVVPFYKNVYKLREIIQDKLQQYLDMFCDKNREFSRKDICIAFSKINALDQYCKF